MRMVRLCASEGLGRPIFSATPASVTCAVPRQGYWLRSDAASTKVDRLEVTALRLLADASFQRRDLSDQLGLGDPETIELLNRLRDHGLVHVIGYGRDASWTLGPRMIRN